MVPELRQIHTHGMSLSHLRFFNIYLLGFLSSNRPALGLKTDLVYKILNS